MATIHVREVPDETLTVLKMQPTVPVALDVVSRHEVAVTVSDDYSGACTADFGPTTSLLRLDTSQVDPATDLTVRLGGVEHLPPTVTASPA